MAERWNLTQTWAWIRWRDAAKVAAFQAEGHIGLAEAMMYPDGTPIIEDGHRLALLTALREGRIATQGVQVTQGTQAALPQLIPKDAWHSIEPMAPSEARHAVAGNRRVAWRGLSFAASEVMRLLPGAAPARAALSINA